VAAGPCADPPAEMIAVMTSRAGDISYQVHQPDRRVPILSPRLEPGVRVRGQAQTFYSVAASRDDDATWAGARGRSVPALRAPLVARAGAVNDRERRPDAGSQRPNRAHLGAGGDATRRSCSSSQRLRGRPPP
jgi:hypothetical protein